MNITNKKLAKAYREILASSINAKGYVNAEIEKVDAKYKVLAEKEKTDLNKQLKALDAQIEMYNTLLNGATTEAPDVENTPEPSSNVEEEPVVTDTIFPENNDAAVEDVQESDDEPVSEEVVESEDNGFAFEEEKEESSDESEDKSDDNDGFPEFPVEW